MLIKLIILYKLRKIVLINTLVSCELRRSQPSLSPSFSIWPIGSRQECMKLVSILSIHLVFQKRVIFPEEKANCSRNNIVSRSDTNGCY